MQKVHSNITKLVTRRKFSKIFAPELHLAESWDKAVMVLWQWSPVLQRNSYHHIFAHICMVSEQIQNMIPKKTE